MPLQSITTLLKLFSVNFPKNKKITEDAISIIKKHNIPPTLFCVSCKNKTLKIFSANPNVRSEIFLIQQNIMSELQKKFNDNKITVHVT